MPSLSLPVLADRAAEVVDSSSLRFLTASALEARRKEEEEEEEEENKEKEKRSAVLVEAAVALEQARLLTEQMSRRRKRKKRRKRRTPRTSSCPSRCRARRRPRRWHTPGCFSSVHAVVPSHVGMPQLPGVIVGMVQHDSLRSSSTPAVAYTGLVSLVFLLALCSSLSLAGPRCSASRLFWTRRTVMRFFLTVACARLVFLVLFTSRCVFSLVCRPMMLGIKAGMDQTDIFALVDTGSCMVKAGFSTAYVTSCVFPWGCRQVCDVSSYLPQVQLLDEVVVPVVCNDICPGPTACSGACWAVGDDFRLVSVFCFALGSTADTCGASVYKAFWKNFSHLYLKRWIAVLEVDSRLSVLPVFSTMFGLTVAGGESFSPDDAYDSAWNSVKPMKGKYTIDYFQYQDDVGCVGMLNGWFCSIDDICADNHNYYQFKLKGKRRSAGGAATQLS